MKTLLYGCTDSAALVYVGSRKVVVNTLALTATPVDEDAEIIEFAADWRAPGPADPVRTWEEIASNSLSQTVKDGEDVTVLSASGNVSRAYSVPSRVRANAAGVADDARLTPTAAWIRGLLANRPQVSLQNLAYMERFFDAHVDRTVSDDVWHAWGGDAARNWVRNTFAKIDTLTASVPEAVNLSAFSDSADDAHTFFGQRADDSVPEVTALYMMTPAGTFLAWADGDWVNCDSPSEDQIVQLDDETAIYVAGALFDAPETSVDLRNLDPDEWDMFADGYAGTDWNMVDLVAAAPNLTPGQYTPQERSKNASAQLRDANGRFAKVGDSGTMSSGVGATITRVDPSTGNLLVKDTNGNQYLVPSGSFKVGGAATVDAPKPSGQPDPVTGTPGSQLPPLDLDEILAEPRATGTTPKAWMKKLLQPMGPKQLKDVVDNYSRFIHQERQQKGAQFEGKGGGFLSPADPHPNRTEKIENHLRKSIHQHERAAKRLEHELQASGLRDPLPDASEPSAAPRPDPDHSDVPPIHLAIVDKDDPRAVTDLCAIVPASSTGNQPTLFRRVGGSWVEDVHLLAKIRSPTPPPVVQLSAADYQDVLSQVDSSLPDDSKTSPSAPDPAAAVAAAANQVEYVAVWDNRGLPVHLVRAFTAAGVDTHPGDTERLRRYWVHGEGALKVRWGTPGDFDRCVRHLEKYLGPRAKGYCQLRHHEAIGIWPATHAHMLKADAMLIVVSDDDMAGVNTDGDVSEVLGDVIGDLTGGEGPDDVNLEPQMTDPKVGDTIDCPGCGQGLIFDQMDGFQAPDGSVGCDAGGVHSDHYLVGFSDDPATDPGSDDDYPTAVVSTLKSMSDHPDWEFSSDSLIAVGEGGLDRNRGGAEKLRRYWLYGPGALKIRWNTPGDWTRCVRHLEKYLGPRAKGYCQLRHHEATGMWTGDSSHRVGLSYSPGGRQLYTTDLIRCQDDIVMTAAARARRELAIAQVKGTMNTPDGPLQPTSPEDVVAGKEFSIPLVIPEGVESGDGRTFAKGALTMRDLPLPIMWQFQTGEGHDGSVLVGRVDHVERTADGLGNATGVFDTGPYGAEAQRLVENGMLRWVSADLDQFEADPPKTQLAEDGDDDETAKGPTKIAAEKMNITRGRLMGITLVPKPAFQEAVIALSQTEEEIPVDDGTYVGEPSVSEAEQIVASAGISEAIPVEPPSVWFDRPILNGVTPITVTDEGQVFGHIATWDRDHIGLPRATRAPRSASNYAYFHTGALRCVDGADVHVGQLTLAGGHADMLADASSAVRHYDDTGSAVADVHVGEDSYGIWCAGALRPGTSPEQIRALRASAPSGDWRKINGRLELVAICQVNVPGFPVPRAQVASGAVCSLVAAGTAVLSRLRVQPMDELDLRIAELERRETARAVDRAAAIRERMAPAYQDAAIRRAELESLAAAARTRVYKVLDVDGYLTEFKDFSENRRKQLAKDGKALPDGSFPIENVADLRRAVHAYGRANDDKKPRVRRHIVKRARALGKPDMIPNSFSERKLNDLALAKADAQEVITASLASRADGLRARLGLPELSADDQAG